MATRFIQSDESARLNQQGVDVKTGMIAYFSMEIGLDTSLPTYSGGLGVLAGDTLQSAADLGVPMVAVSLLYRDGYYHQSLSDKGVQTESVVKWSPDEVCQKMKETVTISIEGRSVTVQAYRYDLRGVRGHILPIYFLDCDLAQNGAYDRSLSSKLYGGDERFRLCQETLLGMGGVAFLEELGHRPSSLDRTPDTAKSLRRYHMNEGHAALLTLELLNKRLADRGHATWDEDDVNWVRQHCLFTTHTPVPAGHDTFDQALTRSVLGEHQTTWIKQMGGFHNDKFNVSYLAMNLSNYTNGVSKRHAEVSRKILNREDIQPITNGVHLGRWISSFMAEVFDQEIPQWRRDNFYVRNLFDVDKNKLAKAHTQAKIALLEKIHKTTNVRLDPETFTVGFARRATEYKRSTLLFEDLIALKEAVAKGGKLQLVFAGKAHPKDGGGKRLIEELFQHAKTLHNAHINMVYIPNYDMDWGRLICAGVDVWLNTPLKPLEASGTSGMKAALNGVPSLSTLDGWWIEGCIEGVTGWEIKDAADAYKSGENTEKQRLATAQSLCEKLGSTIMPTYYKNPDAWNEIIKSTIMVNASYFNTQRMVQQYLQNAY